MSQGRAGYCQAHASNHLPLAGTRPGDKERLLRTIGRALAGGESILRPEYLRPL